MTRQKQALALQRVVLLALRLSLAHMTRVRQLLGRGFLVLIIPLVLTGCFDARRLAFAPPDATVPEAHISKGRALTAVFGEGKLVLAAPAGFCFDPQMETHTGAGGFAMLARCERLNAFSRIRSGESAMVTATIGRVASNTPTPSAETLRSAFISSRSSARVLETRQYSDIPMLKLFQSDHSAVGASNTHWRGAFVVHGHLVSVALYAPDGSRYLGEKGAKLLREFMHATRNATRLAITAPPTSRPGAPEAGPEVASTIRPKARPQKIAKN